jgi:serine/threonine protein kinase
MPEILPLKLSEYRTGTHFLHYQLLEPIGAGGQGFVWSAIDLNQERIIAIKFSEFADSDAQTRQQAAFEQQCSRLITLRHPNILPLYDFGTIQGLRYLVTPYIPGGSLLDKLSGTNLSNEATLFIAANIASALDYLHTQNIIHRDLKPGNVLVGFARNIYVADFGLARILSDSTQAMHTGHGTPFYSPPEQHSQSEITVQSDIFSYGVMLYQLFTGHLPWNGEKTLGIQQLYLSEEIPDPREYYPDLPEGLVNILRHVTAVLPSARPKSASQVIQMLYEVFDMTPIQVTLAPAIEITPLSLGIDALIKQSMAHWGPSSSTIPLSLTKFALADLGEKQNGDDPPENIRNFMLYLSLAYGHSVDFWWKKVEDPLQRLKISIGLFNINNEVITARVLKYLIRDPDLRDFKSTIPPGAIDSVFDVATGSKNNFIKRDILELLCTLIHPPDIWQISTLGIRNDTTLARLAVEESIFSDQAARLVGILHSTTAVSALLNLATNVRRRTVLMQIQEAAGNLPPVVLTSTRLSLASEKFATRVAANPGALLRIFGLASIGATIGSGLQVYLTYRLPNFMDLTRIGISIERGLFMGLFFGFGIFLTRLLVEFLPIKKSFNRAAIASLAGGFVLTTGLMLYDLLFLNTLPGGILYILGCFLIAVGYAISEFIRQPLVKMLTTLACIFAALAGTMYAHLLLSKSPFGMSPIFYYEYSWSAVYILGTILLVSLPFAVFGNLGKFPRNVTPPP